MAQREVTPGAPRSTYAIRLGACERRIIQAGAAQRGEPLSVYIRRVALESARRDLATPTPAER